jgi:hypothetical protein
MKGYRMPDSMIPPDLRQFILQYVESIAQLEGLLLLRSTPGMDWTATIAAQRLYINEEEATRLLARLAGTGLLTESRDDPPAYRYLPSSAELDHMAGRLAEVYSQYLLPVTHLIHSRPKTRIQEFADAFLVRKE